MIIKSRFNIKNFLTRNNLYSDSHQSFTYDRRKYYFDNNTTNFSNFDIQKTTINNSHNITNNFNQNNKTQNINKTITNNFDQNIYITPKETNKKNNKSEKNESTIVNELTEKQLKKIFIFFQDHKIISTKMNFEIFKEKFLKEKIQISCENIVLREFYDNLVKNSQITFNPESFIKLFINTKTNKLFNYGTFKNNANKASKLTSEIETFFRDFCD
ncbi:hypothetical protein EQP59_03185 [Ornithobacterium rhinotracheale]|uniref:Uncharacterized protein n=1 Tax=Ornithobacterium rhinotracheale TaxID=28251 RepID=A0A3R6ATS8_ORNRH|nr:hypothetical protein [Ornithobacterium rhinotracheale]MRJ11323.1 hypothetical protein [Ornithobacterium rhinotracheale]QAR30427.1 hypothetical protein EQP59_03185 [Ornithobacterium rhinotracheale]